MIATTITAGTIRLVSTRHLYEGPAYGSRAQLPGRAGDRVALDLAPANRPGLHAGNQLVLGG